MSNIKAVSFRDINISKNDNLKNKRVNFGQEITVPISNVTKGSLTVFATTLRLIHNKMINSALYNKLEIVVVNLANLLKNKSNKVIKTFNKPFSQIPVFATEEKTIISQYKKHIGNENKIFVMLQNHGMNNESKQYIIDTVKLMQSKNRNSISMREHLKIALNKETPLEVIEDLLTRSAIYRKTWKLDDMPNNNTELANLLLNRKLNV